MSPCKRAGSGTQQNPVAKKARRRGNKLLSYRDLEGYEAFHKEIVGII